MESSGFARSTTDADLWRLATDGDREAFGELFERHAGAIYNFCFRRLADWTIAEDLTSAVFLEAWRRRSDVRLAHDSALPWLYGVAANLIRNHRRGGRRALRALTRVSTERSTGPDPADDVAARLDDERRMREVLGRLAMLRDAEQDAFVLCVWQGLSYREAAVALGVPVGTVRSRLSRARARLRLGTEQDEDASEASSAERDGSGVR